MSLTGYQDWQRVNYETGYTLYEIAGPISATVNSTVFNVQAWQSVLMRLFAPAGSDYYVVNLYWYRDAAGTDSLAQQVCVIGPNSLANLPITVQGPYLQIYVDPSAGGNATTVYFNFFGQSSQPRAFEIGLFATPFIHNSSAYAASEVLNFDVTAIYAGKAFLSVYANSGAIVSVGAYYWDFTLKAFKEYAAFGHVAGYVIVNQEIPMMAAPTRVVVVNGATAQTIVTFLTPTPG